ncbi:MAG TPA: thiamine-phosphate kinase [Chloroflexota bacterium]|nr:thiamine-phosphate kinase [Chloroflexota bacterium]
MARQSDRGQAGETIADIGEFGLISRITGSIVPAGAVVGIGDDAAVLEVPGDEYLLATADMLVEGTHFSGQLLDWMALGRRAFAINASDIAAMGGHPRWVIVSLALETLTPVRCVDELYEGLRAAATEHGASIVGGNLARTAAGTIIDIAMLGAVRKEDVVLRSGARAGDKLAVTGTLGAAAASRLLAAAGVTDAALTSSVALEAIPRPRVQIGTELARAHLAHAMIDLSDGLAGDLRHLCAASQVGARLYADRLPISESTRRGAAVLGVDPVHLALTGGEDYELLVASSPENFDAALSLVGDLHEIGEVLADTRDLKLCAGRVDADLPASGWTHF